MYVLLDAMQTSIHDFVREAGSVRDLAAFLELKTEKDIWRVAQWHSRGVIPWRWQVEYAGQWRKLATRIARKQFPKVLA